MRLQPTNTYFGQKDIQQALILRRLSRDLLLPFPTEDHIHIVPTVRDPDTGLALSSRNAYLSPEEKEVAPALNAALRAAAHAWYDKKPKGKCMEVGKQKVEEWRAKGPKGVKLDLLYIEMSDASNFEPIPDENNVHKYIAIPPDLRLALQGQIIISGAMMVGKTRLIDNVILRNDGMILY
jgi:pantoate--beta-alanine ligase